MNNKFLHLFIALIPFVSFAQEATNTPKSEVFSFVETMPEYLGGQQKMMQFIQQNFQYPDSARSKGIQGRVYVEFVIDTTGKVGEVRIVRGVHSLLDKEAIRIVSRMPNWKPGSQKGKPVKVKYNLPISFKLD